VRFYYLIRLTLANRRRQAALNALPDDWLDHIEENVDAIIELAEADYQACQYILKLK